MELQRVIIQYDPNEDRIRLTGEDESGAPLILWLTRRLLNRLIPVLLQCVEQSGPSIDSDRFPAFRKQAGWDETAPQPSLKEYPDCPQYLIHSVNITQGEAVSLLFHHKDISFSLAFAPQLLRQWLDTLREQYEKAGWPLTCWPEWMQAPVPQDLLMLQ